MLSFKNIKINFGIPASLVLAGFLFSCVNDLDQIRRVTYDPKAPDEVVKDMEVFYTDGGYAKVRIFAKLAETYSNPEQVTKLKDGLKVDFYDEDGHIVSTLTALYGEVRTKEGKMFVRDSVRLYNYEKDQRMETEELNWNQKDSLIFTEKSVVVKTAEGILYGQGVRTKQDFSTYTFIRPTGKIDLDK
jgi:LPS export ABC transporter protein LptC|tara:strand:+ start:4511 stop:5074 length:564 start_codon:yes stop_codon:yes gene_type:complete